MPSRAYSEALSERRSAFRGATTGQTEEGLLLTLHYTTITYGGLEDWIGTYYYYTAIPGVALLFVFLIVLVVTVEMVRGDPTWSSTR